MTSVTIFPDTDAVTAVEDFTASETGLNLGCKFVCNVPGRVTHLRYYESLGANGTFTLRLQDSSGTVLASTTHAAVFNQSGWRNVALGSPVVLTVSAYYMVSVRVYDALNSGNWVYGDVVTKDLSVARSSPGSELSTQADGVGPSTCGNNANGVYTYGALATPTSTFGSSNYGVDVVFELGQDSGPNAAGAAADLGNGTGSWANVNNALGAPNSGWASWTSP